MPRVVAVINQKAGVGKTTTTASLGAAFAELREQVLLIDLDPQAHLTASLGIDPEYVQLSIQAAMLQRTPLSEVVINVAPYLDLIPATIELTASETALLTRPGREYILKESLKTADENLDWILVDAAPSLGVLTQAALTAADDVLIPVHAERMSQRGIDQLFQTINEIRQFTNPELNIVGILPVMFEGSYEVGRGILADLERSTGVRVWPAIPVAHKFAEMRKRGGSILETDPTAPAAMAYRDLARGLIATLPF
jgi:chromosome partitioning protein